MKRIKGKADQARALLKLQHIDEQLDMTRGNLEAIAEKTKHEEAMAGLSQIVEKLADLSQTLRDRQVEEKKREDEDTLIESKIAAEEAKLLSGRVTNPKELVSLQKELVALKKKRDDLDTVCLTALEELERLAAEEAGLKKETADLEKEASDLKREYQRVEKGLLEDRERLSAEREAVISLVDHDLIEEYEYLRRRMITPEVTMIEGDVCGGCFTEISDQSENLEGTSLRKCEHCHRILITS